jgi:hypothetical protein
MQRCSRAFALSGLVSFLIFAGGCGETSYDVINRVESPDRAHVARLEYANGGAFDYSRFKLIVSASDGSSPEEAFAGVNGFAENPVWINSSTLIMPFCYGSLRSVTSVLRASGKDENRFRTSGRDRLIRVHVVTAPNSTVSGHTFCTDGVSERATADVDTSD